MAKGWYSLSSPIWSNFGAGRNLPISCFGSHIKDEMDSILYKNAEVGMMTKHGGGTSGYFGELRPRGAGISTGGESSGPVHFMKMFETTTNVVSQSSVRRGSFAAYFPVEHPNIEEFLQIREEGNDIQQISIGVCISDEWMKDMIAGNAKKRKVWSKIIQKRFESGYPYIFWTDNVNKGKPQVYKDKDCKINASNLCCVTADQVVHTAAGFKTVKELYESGEELSLYDGAKNFNPASPMRLIAKNQPVYTITVASGRTHTITANHKIAVSYFSKENWFWMECQQLDIMRKARGLEKVRAVMSNTNGPVLEDIISINPAGEQDVYCCEVYSQNHAWVCNGFITHNSEIALPSTADESFVCCLSSLNLLHYDDWKNTDAVEILTYFLDAVMTDYINLVKDIPFMSAAYNFAVRHRAIGLGVLGWHSYLQSRMIPFESMMAKLLNAEIWKSIDQKSLAASREMAARYGEPELLQGYSLRNTTRLAVAPTTSSSFILGQVSPSIEPIFENYYTKDLAKGKWSWKNPALKKVLAAHDKDDKQTWDDILLKGGSVQHLPFLTADEKEVFKTFGEISQKEIIIQAVQRQTYIDQSQSINLRIHPSTPPKEVSQLMIFAWENGVKTLYYQRGTNPVQELGRNLLSCKSCEA